MMRRVVVIGSGGAGKSTLARRVAKLTGLPLFHLDAFYWRPGWTETPREEWDEKVADLVALEEWVIDGNYGRSMPARLLACDTVLFLDRPRCVCLWNLLKRRLQHAGRNRPELAVGCSERLTWEFLWWVWRYPLRSRPRVLLQLGQLDKGKQIIVLRSAASIERLVSDLALKRNVRSAEAW